MDNYKYIEDLLDKYWACASNLEEEKQLREFFMQEQALPAHLQQYQALFGYWQEEADVRLSDDFEAKLLEKITATSVTRHLSLVTEPAPSLRRGHLSLVTKIAACFLLLLTIGFFTHQYQKTQEQVAARETVITAIGMLADNLQQGETMIGDGLKQLEILFPD